MKIMWPGIVMAIGLMVVPAFSQPVAVTICPNAMETDIVDLINDIRADSGRSVLHVDRRLIVASRRHSDDMATNEFVSHTGSDGSTYLERAADAGYADACGEVIGAGYTSAEAVVAAWMAGDIQRANILNAIATHIGVGYAHVQNMYEHFYTVVFGRASGAAVPHDCVCCSGRVGDANRSGGDEPTIGDISTLIDALFISGNPAVLPCLAEADINQSGGSDPTTADITIGDVSTLIDYLFITGPSLGLPECL